MHEGNNITLQDLAFLRSLAQYERVQANHLVTLIINYDNQAMALKAAKSERCWSKGQAGNPILLSLENGLLF